MMNRRTFLKTTAVTLTTLAIPTLAKAKEKQQWISLKERFPEKGQHVVMLDVWPRAIHLKVGMVNSVNNHLLYHEYLGRYLLLQVDFSLYRYDYTSNCHYYLNLNSNSAHYSTREILNTPWVNNKLSKNGSFPEFPMGLVPFYSNSSSGQWWIPAPDRIPTTLPPFPSCELKLPRTPKIVGYNLPHHRDRWFSYLYPQPQIFGAIT